MTSKTKVIQAPSQLVESWVTVFSDHAAQTMLIFKNIRMLTWNIMTLGSGRNNAYKKVEDPQDDYLPRLVRIAQKLGEAAKNDQLAIIALQEVPAAKVYRRFFLQALQENLPAWHIDGDLFKRTPPNQFGLLTIYHPDKVSTVLPAIINDLAHQQDRIFALDMIIDNETIRVVNGHFKYSEGKEAKPFSIHDNAPVINKILGSAVHQVIIAADFNQNLEALKQAYGYKIYKSDDTTSFAANKEPEKLKAQKIDGFIFKFEPD